jgi:hypothetical protein
VRRIRQICHATPKIMHQLLLLAKINMLYTMRLQSTAAIRFTPDPPFRAPPLHSLLALPAWIVEPHNSHTYSSVSPSSSSAPVSFFFKCGKLIANTKTLTITNTTIAEMKTRRRLWLYAVMTANAVSAKDLKGKRDSNLGSDGLDRGP